MEQIILTVTITSLNGNNSTRGGGFDGATELWSDGDWRNCFVGSLLLHLPPPGQACLSKPRLNHLHISVSQWLVGGGFGGWFDFRSSTNTFQNMHNTKKFLDVTLH